MANCCNPVFIRCDPGSGNPVVGVLHVDAGTSNYYNADGTAYVGDVNLLVDCETTTTIATAPVAGSSIVRYTDEDGAITTLDTRIPTGAVLPADATAERLFILVGHATLPNSLYFWNGSSWTGLS